MNKSKSQTLDIRYITAAFIRALSMTHPDFDSFEQYVFSDMFIRENKFFSSAEAKKSLFWKKFELLVGRGFLNSGPLFRR